MKAKHFEMVPCLIEHPCKLSTSLLTKCEKLLEQSAQLDGNAGTNLFDVKLCIFVFIFHMKRQFPTFNQSLGMISC